MEDIATYLVEYVKFWDNWEVDHYGNANLVTDVGIWSSLSCPKTLVADKIKHTLHDLKIAASITEQQSVLSNPSGGSLKQIAIVRLSPSYLWEFSTRFEDTVVVDVM
ncbi:hypothetical protein Tco_0211270 [Tanacetum coccineum]